MYFLSLASIHPLYQQLQLKMGDGVLRLALQRCTRFLGAWDSDTS
jgi:hypothetical protein